MFRKIQKGAGFTILLVVLAAGLVFWPLLEVSDAGRLVIKLAVLTAMAAAVWKLEPPAWVRALCVTFGVASIGVALALGGADSQRELAAEHAAGIAFLLLVAGVITRTVWREREVGTETIVGGVAVYLMLAAIFSLAFQLLELVVPGSFVATSDATTLWGPWESPPGHFPRLLFFSVVTLTTVGYGDIVPAGPVAAGLASLEAVVGPLYLTVLISRLVSLHIATPRAAGDSPRPR